MNAIPFEKSFASNEKSKFWSEKNELKPYQVYNVSAKKYLFNCPNCNHEFLQNPSHIKRGRWCPYCCIPQKKLCGFKECISCFDKSFASNEKSKYWSEKNELKPELVLKKSDKRVLFNCDKCNHEWESQVKNISNGYWCPYCANKKMCDNDECKDCYKKSFASHEKSKYWSEKNTKNPRHLFQGDSDRYWFNCDNCNLDFETILYNVKSGYWCPFCVNKTETKFYKIMKELFPSIIYQFKVEWCKNKNVLPFDFCIPEYKIIIEIDGPQHFIQIMNWRAPEKQFEIDKYKEKCANENDYSVIRIIQNDILLEKYNWLKDLCETIEELKNEDEIANVYLCKNGEYALF